VKKTIVLVSIAALAIAVSTACRTTEESSGAEAAASPAEKQIARGQQLYGAHCAKCHGASGQGTGRAPRVVGLDKGALPLEPRPDALREQRFRTAADIAEFVVAEMPPTGDKLAADEYYAILAFALSANGYPIEEPVGPGNAGDLVIPR